MVIIDCLLKSHGANLNGVQNDTIVQKLAPPCLSHLNVIKWGIVIDEPDMSIAYDFELVVVNLYKVITTKELRVDLQIKIIAKILWLWI